MRKREPYRIVFIVDAKVVGDRMMKIQFNSGEMGVVDFKKIIREMDYPIFEAIRSQETFEKFEFRDGTIAWGLLDFDPDHLWNLAEPCVQNS